MGGGGAAGVGICGDSLENARKPMIPNVRKSGIFMLPSEAEASSLTAVPGFGIPGFGIPGFYGLHAPGLSN
jgi:hypothetical protein